MRLSKFIYLVLLIFLTACAQIRSFNLPKGISLLNRIDQTGLQYPIWSPDGTTIIASYEIDPMPDFLGPRPRHDIVFIDPERWDISKTVSESQSNIDAEAWSPDSTSVEMYFSDGPVGNGIYTLRVDNIKPIYLSKAGKLSPDWEKIVEVSDSYIKITNIVSNTVANFKVPMGGTWYISAWSPDMNQITLVHRNHEDDRYDDIYLFDVNSGIFSQFTNDNIYSKSSPIISPNGQLIAYVKSRYAGNTFEYKLIISRLDRSCELTLPLDNISSFAWSPDGQKMFLIGTDGVYLADLKTLFGSNFINGDGCP